METKNQKAKLFAAGSGRKFNVLGHSVTVILSKEDSAGNYYVFECITPPGHGIPPHVHEREDELISILEGEFEVMLGDKICKANAGDEVFFPRHIPHSFQNVGSKAGKTRWTVVPGGNFEEFFDKLGALPAGPPDLQKVAVIFATFGMKILIPSNS